MKTTMWIEGDGATDEYGLRIHKGDAEFVVQGLSREEMDEHLRDLDAQFTSLTQCFDDMAPQFKCSLSSPPCAFFGDGDCCEGAPSTCKHRSLASSPKEGE